MATIKKKRVGTKDYYYLQHSVRVGGTVQTKEKYLGVKLPAKIDALKAEFLAEIYQQRFYPTLDLIKENFAKEQHKMPKSILEKQVRDFSIKFTYDTNRIEGSTLTYRETADLLERGLTPRAKPVRDIKEAESHEKVFFDILDYKKELTLNATLHWHQKLFASTKPDMAGQVRSYQVAISGTKFMPPTPVEVPVLLDEFYRWYASKKDKLHPVELAALVHLKFVTIHPFGDGNGRMSRLMMNFVLHKRGFPMLNIPYENRSSYYHALERAQVKKSDGIFVQWFFKRYVQEYRAYAR